jgi:RecB family exonuclease
MTESQDERLGLPSASRWRGYELCSGSWQLEQEAKRLGQSAHEDSPAARRGSLIHAYLAGIPDEDGTEIKLDDSEQQSAEFLQERATEQVHRIFGEEPTLALAEKRLWLMVNGRKAASGRFDRVIYTPNVALVQDFKTGWAEPDPAEQNAQMKLLAVLVALHMPRTVRKVIVQVISGPFGVTEATYDYPALAKAYEEVLSTLRALQDPLAPLSPSPEACRYCPAVNICQAVKNLIAPVAKTQVSALPDGARGAKLLDEVELLQGHLDSIREYYAAQLSADPAYDLPNYAMVPGSTEREVIDWDKAKLRLGEYLSEEQIKNAASYGIGKIESALARELKLPKAQAKEKFNQILNGLIELKQKKASLKRVKGEPQLAALTQ